MNQRASSEQTQTTDTTSQPLTIFLKNISPDSTAIVGGKAENLGRLINAGFSVPSGFCVTTAAFDLVAANPMVQSTVALLQNSPGLTEAEFVILSAKIRKILIEVPLPSALEREIRLAYSQLDPSESLPMAVRSSATAEDLPDASFAGLQDSYLNISGGDYIIASIRACWASLWNDRAIAYRKGTRHTTGVKLAVVVQNLVHATNAGVLFTANPLTGRRHETVIDATWGLGEAIVSGAVVPDHFRIDTQEKIIIERTLGSKQVKTQLNPGGGTQTEINNAGKNAFCLDDQQILQLVDLGRRVEHAFGKPQDIEWVIDHDAKLWVVQARPITTLYPLSETMANSDTLQVYYSINASQGMERPFTPLGESLFRLLVSAVASFAGFPPNNRYIGPGFLQTAGGRLFLNISKAIRHKIARSIVLGMVEIAESRAGSALTHLAQDPRFALQPTSLANFARRALSFFIRANLPFYILQSLFHPKRAVVRIAQLRSYFERQARIKDPQNEAERFQAIDRLFSVQSLRRLVGIMPSVLLPSMIFTGIAKKLLQGLATDEEIESTLLSVPDNPTMTMNLALAKLANQIRILPDWGTLFSSSSPEALTKAYRTGDLPVDFQDQLSDFLRIHGHRCATELDGGLARWSEDPTPVFAILKGYLQDGTRHSETIFSEGSLKAEMMIVELARRVRVRGTITAAIVRGCLHRARLLQGQREVPRFYIALLLAKARDLIHPLGNQLVTSGRLPSLDGLNFLSVQEIKSLLVDGSLPDTFGERQSVYDREVRRRAPPALLLSDGSQPEAPFIDNVLESTDHILVGIAASRGVVSGRARIIFDPQGARLEPGEILVAPTTDPGWTPLFLIASGVVMETGGPMCHGAIVAREYGIPAVVAVPSATSRIQDGQLIWVDGSKGQVWLSPPTQVK